MDLTQGSTESITTLPRHQLSGQYASHDPFGHGFPIAAQTHALWAAYRATNEGKSTILEAVPQLRNPVDTDIVPRNAVGALSGSQFTDPMPKRIVTSFPGLEKRAESVQPHLASSPLTKTDLQSTFRVILAPQIGAVPSQNSESTEQTRETVYVGVKRSNSTSESSVTSTPVGTTFITGITQSGQVPARASSRKARQYLLPNGTVAMSGKGLGRGRPGIKRGPRKAKSEEEDSNATNTALNAPSMAEHVTPAPLMADTIQTSNPNAPQSGKRKRESGASIDQQSTPTPTSLSRDSSLEYNPTATQTRSGRSTQKPLNLVAQTPVTESPGSKKPRNLSTSTPTPAALKTHPKIKRRIYRGREQSALCEHCQRGYGPPKNVIVFCDACNKCWHQQCHEPQISKELVSDVTAEWFCADCDRILHGKKKAAKNNKRGSDAVQSTALAAPPAPATVGSNKLTLEQRKAYLHSLPKDRLLSIVLHACDLYPNVRLFDAPNPAMPATPQLMPASAQSLPVWAPSQVTSTYITPVDHPNPFVSQNSTEPLDEGYDDYLDEHAALYPKPGNGIKLPPESSDMNILLEGADCSTFSHWVRPLMPPAAIMSQARHTVTATA